MWMCGYCDCDVCTVVCVACVYAENVRVRGGRQCWCGGWRGEVVVSAGHVGGTRGSGIVSSAPDITCICLWQISQIQTFCQTWICLDITRVYEEQHQPSSGSALHNKKGISGPHCWRVQENLHTSLEPAGPLQVLCRLLSTHSHDPC